MVSFIYNGSELATWMGHSFKTKSTKSRATSFTITPSFLIFNQQIIRLAQGHWSCTSSHQNSYFYSCTYEKTYVGSSLFHQRVIFVNLLIEKLYGFSAKVLSTCWIYMPDFYFFSLHKIKTSKHS